MTRSQYANASPRSPPPGFQRRVQLSSALPLRTTYKKVAYCWRKNRFPYSEVGLQTPPHPFGLAHSPVGH